MAGPVTITVTTNSGNKSASCTVNVISGAVDLGLSVLWATCNLGASNPWGYGGYYQWGGTDDVTDTNIILNWANCPYHTGSDETTGWTKYVSTFYSSYWSGTGDPDDRTVLDPADDAAHVILGGDWRMPTETEWKELLINCTWEWTDNYNTMNVAGYIVTSKKEGYADRSIFLPAAGYRTNTYLYDGSRGLYWSSSLYESLSNYARILNFSSDSHGTSISSRYYGRSVRPVCP